MDAPLNLSEALLPLAAMDERLNAQKVVRATLAPDREQATTLVELGEVLGPALGRLGLATARTFALGMSRVSETILTNFPENIFWDLDYLAANLVRDCAVYGGEAEPRDSSALPVQQSALRLERAFDQVVRLHAAFGIRGPISFRYIHDFIYGFDWAKWVQRAPEDRQQVLPFDRTFLLYTEERGTQLLQLIADDDAKYPKLDDSSNRNPFSFSRDPEVEVPLHRALAIDLKLPVRAWDIDAVPAWNRPYGELRKSAAAQLS